MTEGLRVEARWHQSLEQNPSITTSDASRLHQAGFHCRREQQRRSLVRRRGHRGVVGRLGGGEARHGPVAIQHMLVAAQSVPGRIHCGHPIVARTGPRQWVSGNQ